MEPWRKIEQISVTAIVTIPILFVIALVFLKWPAWWMWVIFERTPMTWLQSVLLFSSGILALACAGLATVNADRREQRVWLLCGGAFIYLTIDERFAIHERIRDKILVPSGYTGEWIPWIAPGDYLLLILLGLGLIFVPTLLKVLRKRISTAWIFIMAVVISAMAVILDSVDVSSYSIGTRRLEQFLEEILELFAMLLFLVSFFLSFSYRIKLMSVKI